MLEHGESETGQPLTAPVAHRAHQVDGAFEQGPRLCRPVLLHVEIAQDRGRDPLGARLPQLSLDRQGSFEKRSGLVQAALEPSDGTERMQDLRLEPSIPRLAREGERALEIGEGLRVPAAAFVGDGARLEDSCQDEDCLAAPLHREHRRVQEAQMEVDWKTRGEEGVEDEQRLHRQLDPLGRRIGLQAPADRRQEILGIGGGVPYAGVVLEVALARRVGSPSLCQRLRGVVADRQVHPQPSHTRSIRNVRSHEHRLVPKSLQGVADRRIAG